MSETVSRGGPVPVTYRLEDGPTHVTDPERASLPGHYEAAFRGSDGTVVHRYVTDKGRAWLLHRIDDGGPELSEDELHDRTVEPNIEALVARMEHESGDGA